MELHFRDYRSQKLPILKYSESHNDDVTEVSNSINVTAMILTSASYNSIPADHRTFCLEVLMD